MRLSFEDKVAVVVGATSAITLPVDGGSLLYNAGSA